LRLELFFECEDALIFVNNFNKNVNSYGIIIANIDVFYNQFSLGLDSAGSFSCLGSAASSECGGGGVGGSYSSSSSLSTFLTSGLISVVLTSS